MTIGQLRTFLAVATTGSVRRAAEHLVVTQPAVSAALATLQQEVGVALVIKEGRGLRLSPAGEAFAIHVRRALGLLDQGVAASRGAEKPEGGRLRLAAVTSAGEHLAPSLLAAFLARYPEVEVSLEVGNRRRIWDLVAHHEADLAIGGRPPSGVTTLAVRPHQLVVVAAPRPGARRGRGRTRPRQVTFSRLAEATWLLREPGSGTRAAAEELLGHLDLAPRVVTVGSNGALVESVRAGLGITLISRDAVSEHLAAGALEEWRHDPLPMDRAWHLVTVGDEAITGTPKLFLDQLLAAGWRRP